MPSIRLTQAAVDKLRPPAEGRVDYWDALLPQFGLRVSPTSKSWVVMYRVGGKKRRETLGTLAQIPRVDDARERARRSMQLAHAGKDPVKEAAQVRQDRVGDCLDRYFERAEPRMRPSYFAETVRQLNRDFRPALGDKAIRDLSRADIRDVIETVMSRGAPQSANCALRAIKAFGSWAVDAGLIEHNPALGLRMPAAKVERDRWLDDAEVALFWRGCRAIGWPYAGLFQLLLLTGQRRDEVAGMEWRELDLLDRRLWTLPRERAKNDRAHLVHLAPPAVAILTDLPRIGDRYVFAYRSGSDKPIANFAKARQRLDQAMLELNAGKPIPHWTLHDLRRTSATHMAELGVAHHVVDRILNHVAGKISGVARIYNRAEFLPERQAALELWARHIEHLVGESEVLRLAG